MSVLSEPPRQGFEIGKLLSDTRYRSYTIQIVALFAVMLGIAWLLDNMFSNLAELGKEIGFNHMTDPASYDINQRLIDYTSRSSHATAAVVGILNTLLVAVLGCAAATIIGVLAGVARLSKNWILSRLMTVFVEAVRNVPVLLQILLMAAVFDEALPHPSQAADVMGIVATNRGFYLPQPIFLDGSYWVVLAAITGLVAAIWFGRWSEQRLLRTGEEIPAWSVTAGRGFAVVLGLVLAAWVVMGMVDMPAPAEGESTDWLGVLVGLAIRIGLIALVVYLLWEAPGLGTKVAFVVLPAVAVYFALGGPIGMEQPELGRFNIKGGIHARNSLVALWLALSIYTAAFIAEIVRAGITAVSHGQTEAAYALGLRPGKTTRLIILPQALRIIIPPLISQYLNLTKNSSLAIAVGYMDATGTLGGITLNQTGREMECLLLLMAFYLMVSLAISAVMNLYNEQVKLVERTSATGFTFSFADIFGAINGRWERLKKGDAREHPAFGVTGWLNPIIAFYIAVLLGLLHYVFIGRESDVSYWQWGMGHQLLSLMMVASFAGVLMTALFKNNRFIDFTVVALVLWLIGWGFGSIPMEELMLPLELAFKPIIAAITGNPDQRLIPQGLAAVVGAGIQVAILLYLIFGTRPNVTYLNRIREGRA